MASFTVAAFWSLIFAEEKQLFDLGCRMNKMFLIYLAMTWKLYME